MPGFGLVWNTRRAMKATDAPFHCTKPLKQTQRISLYFMVDIDLVPSHCATVALCSLHRYRETSNTGRLNNIHSGRRGHFLYRRLMSKNQHFQLFCLPKTISIGRLGCFFRKILQVWGYLWRFLAPGEIDIQFVDGISPLINWFAKVLSVFPLVFSASTECYHIQVTTEIFPADSNLRLVEYLQELIFHWRQTPKFYKCIFNSITYTLSTFTATANISLSVQVQEIPMKVFCNGNWNL